LSIRTNLPAQDTRVGDLVQNPTEASLVHQITETLLRSGVTESQIGMISLYRQQIKLLSHLLQDHKRLRFSLQIVVKVEIRNASLFRWFGSNDAGQVLAAFHCLYLFWIQLIFKYQLGDLVKDWRRMNVSFHSRALETYHHWLSQDASIGTSAF